MDRSPRIITFRCPKCGEAMEIGTRMRGRQVRCVECDRLVTVPEEGGKSDEGLSGQEWLLYGLLFLVIPAVNVLLSSILYYVWKGTQPRRANQINLLGFLIFGCHIGLGVLLALAAPGLFKGR
jgi:hypothetical protein